MSEKHANRGFGGRGYYIALILCAAAIGISGYVYYSQTQQTGVVDDTPVLATQNSDAGTVSPGRNSPDITPTQATVGKLSTCSPVDGNILAEYAMECLGYNPTTRDWRTHNGIDIAAEAGTQVVAAADGQVYTVYEDDQMGTTVVIRHDGGYTTKYSSLDAQVSVSAGDTVQMGQAIGCVGTTALMESGLGDHVHFSVTHNDILIDPGVFLE